MFFLLLFVWFGLQVIKVVEEEDDRLFRRVPSQAQKTYFRTSQGIELWGARRWPEQDESCIMTVGLQLLSHSSQKPESLHFHSKISPARFVSLKPSCESHIHRSAPEVNSQIKHAAMAIIIIITPHKFPIFFQAKISCRSSQVIFGHQLSDPFLRAALNML